MYLTEPDKARLMTALGESLAGKIIAGVEEAASRGNLTSPATDPKAKPKKKGKGK